MANVKQCDRCKKVWAYMETDAICPNGILFAEFTFSSNRMHMGDEQVELCPKCLGMLRHWISGVSCVLPYERIEEASQD